MMLSYTIKAQWIEFFAAGFWSYHCSPSLFVVVQWAHTHTHTFYLASHACPHTHPFLGKWRVNGWLGLRCVLRGRGRRQISPWRPRQRARERRRLLETGVCSTLSLSLLPHILVFVAVVVVVDRLDQFGLAKRIWGKAEIEEKERGREEGNCK